MQMLNGNKLASSVATSGRELATIEEQAILHNCLQLTTTFQW